jgi:acyl-coenzyme A thioesterase 13
MGARALPARPAVNVPEGFVPYENQGPFLEHVGPVHVREGDGELVFGLRAEERHANHRGTIQGGLLSTFADFALGRAIEADADDDRDRATVSLTVDYLKPARPGDWIESSARVDRVGGTLAFADCSLAVDGREIVRARAVWVVA